MIWMWSDILLRLKLPKYFAPKCEHCPKLIKLNEWSTGRGRNARTSFDSVLDTLADIDRSFTCRVVIVRYVL